MTTKLTFRARNLDVYRPLSIYFSDELPEPTDQNAINRSVPAMPTGMEKEEEAEKHLQDILERNGADNLYIPTPEVLSLDVNCQYKKMYRGGYVPPMQYIQVQPFPTESEAPSYDMDSEDEKFLEENLKKKQGFEIDALLFEEMIDKLENNSGHNVITVQEAKRLLPGDDELILAIYDYWVSKRRKLRNPLIPAVRSDKKDAGTVQSGHLLNSNISTNPYIAFRRRTEKMLTRKNRKNDEISYEKMLKLRRDLTKAILIVEMVKNRENKKKELISLALELFEKRYQAGDFEGKVIQELNVERNVQKMTLQLNRGSESRVKQRNNQSNRLLPISNKKRKRFDKKHPNLQLTNLSSWKLTTSKSYTPTNGPEFGTAFETDEDRDFEMAPYEKNIPGPYLFKRKANCWYYKNKRYLPFGISRPPKQPKVESQTSDDQVETEDTDTSDTSGDDDDFDRKVLWSSSGSVDFKKHAKDFFPCSFHPLPSKTIAFASRRLSRNSRIVLDLAQVTLPKKFNEEGYYVDEYVAPEIGDQIMKPQVRDCAKYWLPSSNDGWFEGISQSIPNTSSTENHFGEKNLNP